MKTIDGIDCDRINWLDDLFTIFEDDPRFHACKCAAGEGAACLGLSLRCKKGDADACAALCAAGCGEICASACSAPTPETRRYGDLFNGAARFEDKEDGGYYGNGRFFGGAAGEEIGRIMDGLGCPDLGAQARERTLTAEEICRSGCDAAKRWMREDGAAFHYYPEGAGQYDCLTYEETPQGYELAIPGTVHDQAIGIFERSLSMLDILYPRRSERSAIYGRAQRASSASRSASASPRLNQREGEYTGPSFNPDGSFPSDNPAIEGLFLEFLVPKAEAERLCPQLTYGQSSDPDYVFVDLNEAAKLGCAELMNFAQAESLRNPDYGYRPYEDIWGEFAKTS